VGLSSNVISIAGGAGHTCALTSLGGVKCWGSNYYGQIGNNFAGGAALSPFDVVDMSEGVVEIAAGQFHNCGVLTNGSVKCWGRNGGGQIGDNTTVNRRQPVLVQSMTAAATAVSAGSDHSCVLYATGAVACWGRNAWGQLGDGTVVNHHLPTPVHRLTSDIAEIAAGSSNNCAKSTTGQLKCWGANDEGQLGDGTNVQRLEPVDVYVDTLTLSTQTNPSEADEAVVFSAILHNVPAPIGSLTFCADPATADIGCSTGTPLCTAAATSAPVTCQTENLTPGTHKIRVTYGDATSGLRAAASRIQVVQPYETATALSSDSCWAAPGDSVALTAFVDGHNVSGFVGFKDGDTPINGCSAVTLVDGMADCAFSNLTLGSHMVFASYSGDANNAPSAAVGKAGVLIDVSYRDGGDILPACL
jgi:hypothetical protein